MCTYIEQTQGPTKGGQLDPQFRELLFNDCIDCVSIPQPKRVTFKVAR